MKIKLFLVSIFIWLSSLNLFGQSFTKLQRINEYVTVNETRLNGELNGARCYYWCGKPNMIELYEKNNLLFMMYIDSNCRLCFVIRDIEKNDLLVPEDSRVCLPGYLFSKKCYCICFYESGNLQKTGIMLYDNDDPIFDCYDYGEHVMYEDFGKAIHYKHETESSIVYETRLDGKNNGFQLFQHKPTGFIEKINYYKLGDLKAQFLFNADGSIKSIVYEIEPDDTSSDYKYRGKYLEYAPDGTKIRSTELSFNDLPQ